MIGKTVGHYRVIGKLGDGGMGAVYRAEDLTLQRSVALKFLSPEIVLDSRARRRLLQEARVSSRLGHPNIATIYEVGDVEETPFIAMELVEGETLTRVLERGPMPVEKVRELAIQISEGLMEAHRKGVLHRDIKPGNLMVDERGRARILDFGLAITTCLERRPGESAEAFVSRSVSHATTGGTVPYMAPEQLRGAPPDARSDVFSFGVVIYECLTGTRTFPGETAVDVMHAILHSDPEPLRTHRPDLPGAWGDFVDRCLQKEEERRYGSMGEVLEALEALRPAAARPPGPGPAGGEAKSEKSVAVLYFENLGGSAEDEYFRDGITEDVITEISKISGIGVYPRSAVLAYRDRHVTAPEVGRELGARFVLTGSLRRAGNRLRITTQLVTAANGQAVWAERFDRTMEDVFSIQDEIAQSIARALRVVLTEKEKKAIQKRQTADVQAYDYYLQGRQFFHQFRRKGFDFARQMFARAIVIDPNYARAYAGVAYCCSQLYAFWEAREANLKEADAASRKALELDPDLAEAHVARGLAVSLNRRFEEAGREFETAIQQDPTLFEAYYFYARACLAQGNLEEAAHLFQRASEVRPEDYQAPALLGSVFQARGRPSEAEAAYHRALDAAERHLELHPDDARALYLGGFALAEIGQRARSLDWARRALALDPNEPLTLYNVACLYATLGEVEQGIDCLEKSVKDGYSHRDWILNDSTLNPLRESPRFQKLLAGL